MLFNISRGSSNMETLNESDGPVHGVTIIGAGPCSLAVAARLCEHTPSVIFTDGEHQRYHRVKKHNGRMSIKHKKDGGFQRLSSLALAASTPVSFSTQQATNG